jgi:ATP-binding protein involved in chromosome partitioning
MPTEPEIVEALTQVIDPELKRSIVELGMVRGITIEGDSVGVTLALTIMGCPMKNHLKEQIQKMAGAVPGVGCVEVTMIAMTEDERRELRDRLGKELPEGCGSPGPNPRERMPAVLGMNRVARVVAVMSGKGGVGKSSLTALLASSLRKQGFLVGVLDADITGPSIPRLFGVRGPVKGLPMGMLPIETRTGIKVMSVNLLLPEEDMAVIWRGPVMSNTIRQFWKEVLWGRLDYLLVDLPPGTSDATLTVMESLPLDGVVMVATPQSLASMIVRKTVFMAQSMNIPVLGVIENMSYYVCPETGVHHQIFGPSHVEEVAELANAPIIGRLPIDPELARYADAGLIEDYTNQAYLELSAAFSQVVPPKEIPSPISS